MERRPAFSIVRIIIKSRAMKNVHKIKFHKKKSTSSLALWLSYLIKTAFTLEKRDICFNFWGWRLYKFVYIHSLGPAESPAFHSLPRMQGLNVLARGTDYAGACAVPTVTSYVRVNVCTLVCPPKLSQWLESADLSEQEKHRVKLHQCLSDPWGTVTFR